MPTTTESHVVHFTITGEFVTNHARDLVIEESWERAIRFLVDSICGLTYDHAIAILSGKMCMTGVSCGEENTLDLVKQPQDDEKFKSYMKTLNWQYQNYFSFNHKWWTPYAWVSNVGRADLTIFSEDGADSKLSDRNFSSTIRGTNWALRPRYYMNDKKHDLLLLAKVSREEGERPVLWEERKSPPIWMDIKNTADQAVAKTKYLEERGHQQWFPHEYDNDAKLRKGFAKDNFKDKQVVVIEEKPPVPDRELKWECGWILPNGDFYGCSYQGHIDLADDIFHFSYDKKVKNAFINAEKAAEDQGWLKIGRSILTPMCTYFAFSTINQAQMNTLHSWCQKHEVSYPSERIEILLKSTEPGPNFIEVKEKAGRNK